MAQAALRRFPRGMVISKRAPRPGSLYSLISMSVMLTISLDRKRQKPVFLP